MSSTLKLAITDSRTAATLGSETDPLLMVEGITPAEYLQRLSEYVAECANGTRSVSLTVQIDSGTTTTIHSGL